MSGKKGFLKNTAIMFTAMIITKCLGAVLKIPLGNIIGGEGMGYYTTAYSIFTPVLSFVCAGIPSILMRNAAALSASGKNKELSELKHCSLILAVILGLAGTAAVLIAAIPFVYFIADSPESLSGILLIAPSVLFCSVTAVYRGYYEGSSDAMPTAVSQVIEGTIKAVLGIGLSYYVYYNGERLFGSSADVIPYSAAAAIFGVTVSELAGLIYFMHISRKENTRRKEKRLSVRDTFRLCGDLFKESLPISLGSAAANIIAFADMLTISNCIDLSLKHFPDENMLPQALAYASDAGKNAGNFMFGCYTGIVISVYMLAVSVSGVVSRCMLPRLASAIEKHDEPEISENIKLLIKGTGLMTAPLTFILAALSGPVLRILYPMRQAEASICELPLAVLSTGGIISAVLAAVETVFFAYGEFRFPVRMTLVGGMVKLLLNIVFVPVPEINICGAALAAVISDIVCFIWALARLKRLRGKPDGILRMMISSFTAGLASSAAAWFFFTRISLNADTLVSLLISAGLAAVVYAVIVIIIDNRDFVYVVRLLREKRFASKKRHDKLRSDY